MSAKAKPQKRKYELKARAERQSRTRERIVQATMELHREVGPAKTTVAEVARRAGVQRLTVYNHFSKDIELFGACQARWMSLHPLPDFSSALAAHDPSARLRTVLRGYYAWYRETEPMAEKIQRDRWAVPELNALMEKTADMRLAQLTDALARGFHPRGRLPTKERGLIRLALDFWTWRRLSREGLDDTEAAELMTDAIAAAANTRSRRR